MLGTYLWKEHGIETSRVMGRDTGPEPGSHAWLRYGRHVIDITGDQFPDRDLPLVFVGLGTLHDSTWTEERVDELMSEALRDERLRGGFAWWHVYQELRAILVGGDKPTS